MADLDDISELKEDIRNLAVRAVQFDEAGAPGVAGYYYTQTAKLMQKVLELGGGYAGLQEKMEAYAERGKILSGNVSPTAPSKKLVESGRGELARAYYLLAEALTADENGQLEEAVELYTESVELCLKAKNETNDRGIQEKLNKVAGQALSRAENIKYSNKSPQEESLPSLPSVPSDLPLFPAIPDDLPLSPASPSAPTTPVAKTNIVRPLGNLILGDSSGGGSSGGSGYSDEEKKVLAITSNINGREYVPFMAADLRERFAFPVPFTDKHGMLSLSPKQKQKLSSWCRPDEFIENPKMAEHVNSFSVKQTIVSDCSFVASIAISAQYEKKYRKRLITSILYPQNKAGEPMYNPAGKYMVKLHINGVDRKVVVDDYLPLGTRNELLCSYSSNKSELWISLLEKAYMKVMGGYDFPGSNSNIDLYALTGWIPERVSMKPDDPTFNADAEFRNLHDRFHQGQVLATVATGEMSETDADRAGLVPTHAYAVLDVREVLGEKLFLVKNPWSHLRWRGNWSEIDTRHWTPEFRKALNYNPEDAQNFDNGVFWIDYKSLQHYFDVLYKNWDPDLFKHKYHIHHSWRAGAGPVKDMFNIGENPQFSLEIKDNISSGGAVWLLLSRHITDIDDFRNNKEYITLVIYKNDGKRVYYPFDPPPFIDGVRINSPHYLTKIHLKPGDARRYTLVVSQYEKTATIYYTVRAYSTLPFTLAKIGNPYRNKQELTGQWKGRTAGGCGNHRDTWQNNPHYRIVLDSNCHLQIQLKAPKQFQIGMDIVCVSAQDKDSPNYFKKKPSGLYRSGFVVMSVEAVAGTYDIVPSTYKQDQESAFFLIVSCSASFKIQ